MEHQPNTFTVTSMILFLIVTGAPLVQAQARDRPNFVFIFTDDLGFGDLACYGHPYAKTDNIDRLAREGTLFRQFHVNGNICPVSRAGLMTGRNPAWFPNYTEDFGFDGSTTVTKYLQQAGYRTGHVGKWNIGPVENIDIDKVEYGIDELTYLPGSPFDPLGRERARFDAAIGFIERNKDRPFYLNLWALTVHTPIVPPQDYVDQFSDLTVDRGDFGFHMQSNFERVEAMGESIDETMRLYLADILALDVQVGRLLDKLDELSLTEKTVVVFTSDNGPADVEKAPKTLGYAGGLRGGKHTFYEGGTRVPFLVRWPGHVPAERVDDSSIMFGTDWLTTVCSLAEADYPSDLVEGEDMSDVWLGNTRSRTNPLYFRNIANNGRVAVRYGKWKFHQNGRELFDLSDDPFERSNLYSSRPDVVKAMSDSADQWVETLPPRYAFRPDTPVAFDPMQPVPLIPLPNVNDAFPDDGTFAGPSQYSAPRRTSEAQWGPSLPVLTHLYCLLLMLFLLE